MVCSTYLERSCLHTDLTAFISVPNWATRVNTNRILLVGVTANTQSTICTYSHTVYSWTDVRPLASQQTLVTSHTITKIYRFIPQAVRHTVQPVHPVWAFALSFQSYQSNGGFVHTSVHGCLLPNPFYFIINLRSYRSTLYNLWNRRNKTHKKY
jgi:hypothetical protein